MFPVQCKRKKKERDICEAGIRVSHRGLSKLKSGTCLTAGCSGSPANSGGYVFSGRRLTEGMKGADAVPTEGKAQAKMQR